MGLCHIVPKDEGLQALYKILEERTDKKILSTDLVEMAEFILKNNFFEFGTKITQQISGTAIGTRFVQHLLEKKIHFVVESADVKLVTT